MEASSQERKLFAFPVLPGADQDFVIDEEDYNVVHEILAGSGINYKLTRVQQMVRLNENRRICKLFMPPNNDIILPLPASIEQLKELTHLVLGKRFLTVASLPDAIGDLENLRHLCLRGSGISSLPPSFGRLTNLESLDVSCTKNLTIAPLPDTMGGLVNLRHLCLRGSAVASLPSSFGRWKKLEFLDVSYTQNLFVLPQDIGNLVNLKRLDVRGAMIVSLPPSIMKCHHLVTIDISSTPNVLKLIRKVWGKPLSNYDSRRCFIACLPLTQMDELLSREYLGFSFENWSPQNSFSYGKKEIGVGAYRLDLSGGFFANSLRNILVMTNLRDLDLSFTRNFKDFPLPEQIGNLRSLEILDLKSSDVDSLPLSIGRLQNLRVLDLSSTMYMTRLPMSIAQLHNLEYLDLSVSRISHWPTYMRCLEGLVHLNLVDSWINDKRDFEFMAMIIEQHPSLESLALVRDTWNMRSELVPPMPEPVDHRISVSARYKMLKIALVHRGIKSSRLQSSKLWPRKLKKMTLDFKDHAEADRGYRVDYRPEIREADVIYRFLRNTVCHVPNQIWQN